MRRHNRSNALLVELLIVILFFMLSATVLVEVFAASRQLSDKAGQLGEALTEAQNVAEQLYAAEDGKAALGEMRFLPEGELWMLALDGYTLKVIPSIEETGAGQLMNYAVQAVSGEETLFTLPVSRYMEAQP